MDAGSTDGSREAALSHGARIIEAPRASGNQEYQKGLGIREAGGEFVLLVDSDNFLPDSAWVLRRLRALDAHPEAAAASPLRYAVSGGLSPLNRYFALMGANDPVAYYLNKRDRLSWAEEGWPLLGKAEDKGDYFLVDFDPQRFPTVGANGYMVRRRLLNEAGAGPENFFDIDCACDLARRGHSRHVFLKDEIIHETAQTLPSFLAKRFRYMLKHHHEKGHIRRWSLVGKADLPRLFLFVVYALTLIVPFVDAWKGWRKKRDTAWFLNPIVCFGIAAVYSAGALWGAPGRLLRMGKGAAR